MMRPTFQKRLRRGAVLPLTVLLMALLLAMVAFSVDIGYMLVARNEAQNAADSAALAGMDKLAERLKQAPIAGGAPVQTSADLSLVREEVKAYARKNAVGSRHPEVLDSDIQIGYLANPRNANNLDTTGWPARPYNAVRVTVARDANHAGGPLKLFFAPLLGKKTTDTTAKATAAVSMGTVRPKGNNGDIRGGILPFAYQVDQWNALLSATGPGTVTAANGTTVTVTDHVSVDPQSSDSSGVGNGSDQRMETKLYPGNTTSGNYGTLNFSKSKVSNSTSVMRDLILHGPNEADWHDLPDILAASPTAPVAVNGDPGISDGMESAVQAIVGEAHIIPLYTTVSGSGNNSFYRVVGFAPVTIVDVNLSGGTKYITFQPRITSLKSSVIGSSAITFGLTPSANPNPLYLGARGLVQ